MNRKAPLSSSLAALFVVSALAALPGCKEEDNRLFDENGVWSMTHFSNADGDLLALEANTSEDAFMIKFDSGDGVATTAACSFGGGSNDPGSSTCRLGEGDQLDWTCKCFAYEFDDSTMRMIEFAPGEARPSVPSGSGDTDGTDGPTEIAVGDYEAVSNSYIFQPLPMDLFASNGVDSRFVFLSKYGAVFDETGCAEACQ
jgi:hypothetical protein